MAAHCAQTRGLDLREVEQKIDEKVALLYQIEAAEARLLAEFIEKSP
jgi:hypothetical protein